MATTKQQGTLAKWLRDQAKNPVQGDLFAPACPSRGILDHLTSRWGVLVLVVLIEGTHRFSELRRLVAGVSEKMLAQTLRELEADGFVLRIVYPEVPPHVEYQLTDLGREVALHIEGLTDWIQENLSRILEARTKTAKRRSSAIEPQPAATRRRAALAPPALANSKR